MSEMNLEQYLYKYFQFNRFREGQKEIIQDVLHGEDVLGILPTGSGKSICYQLPALMMEGITIVVSPLISLMIDQVKQLKARQVKRVTTLNSFMSPEEKRKIVREIHTYKLLFISPELLQQEYILTKLSKVRVSLFVIDEAHCISQWGHDFRPDYLKLSSIREALGKPPILALSATATPEVQDDIMQSLKITDMKKHVYPMDKPNIAFCIEKTDNDNEKNAKIISLLMEYKVSTLIYFSSRSTAEKVTQMLTRALPNRRIGFYHGGMEHTDRIMIQQQFMNDQLDVVCCTSAFGMGIDKSNIRLIIHYHLPLQIESFIQEVGRAGRDGKSSVSLLLFSEKDFFIPNHIIKSELPDEGTLKNIYTYLKELSLSKKELPNDEIQIQQIFQINEVQWRFIQHHLEIVGILNKRNVTEFHDNWNNYFQSIFQVIHRRVKLKERKLSEMIRWIAQEKCLRVSLYESFQSTNREALEQCCSNCGFSWTKWKPEPLTSETQNNKAKNWEQKLKELLLVEEK